MSSNIHLKEAAISLRRSGLSYNVIRKRLNIKSKGTLSFWFKNLELSAVQRKKLRKNNHLSYVRGLRKANTKRTLRIKNENINAGKEGEKLIGQLSKRDLLLIGAALYWGEGTKSQKRTSASLVFSNSDPKMVRVFMMFIRKILLIKEEKIRSGIHLYSNISEEKARIYWSNITNLPKDRFYIVTQVSRASQNKRPFNSLPFGTIAIKINSRIQFYKILGMIKGLSENFL
ncbi:MAG: hypothetical protein ABI430_02325 [Candidatus Taylorbacteria bacterium]